MKQFDKDLRRNKYKNKDHFHVLQAKDIFKDHTEGKPPTGFFRQ
jgi:hypothetical protein